MSCKPPSCLITRLGNTSVLPKWLRRGTPTIPGHPVVMGPPGFHRATHKNRAASIRAKNASIPRSCAREGGYAEEVGELTPNGRERVGPKDALGYGRGPLDERRVLFDCGRQLRPLEVEYCMFGVLKLHGDPQEDPIHRSFREHDHISDDALNPEPSRCPSGVAKLCAPEFYLVGASMSKSLRNAAREYLPSRGRATDACEKESPLTVYDP
ncbi:hypothetical protein CRG98_001924 [Punica granatum]|uniref:Uncharacterized protein n=1 Tax=Punica granatum TaxID=22663 RepID=A0A2I0LAH8_PUNGR|nr:hypothetical protein CRG98_001924 [Punica granatum]